MIREIRTFEIECGRCHARERYEAPNENRIPEGWVKRSVAVYDDMYGYRDVTLCPACAAADADSLVPVT